LFDTFLAAEWRNLLMLNYEVPTEMLTRHMPRGVELDLYEGRALVSLVGFRFLRTRVLGRVPVPFHVDFDELNLRFYVKRHMPGEGTRRGVCFIREFVPRWAIAFVARQVYEEPYRAVPMRHELMLGGVNQRACYRVKVGGKWHTMEGRPVGEPILATDDPAVSFITEHYWGYTARSDGSTSEYQVVHPVWRARKVEDARFEGDPAAVYGAEWRAVLSAAPHSAFLADGSAVSVMRGASVAGKQT
jgi:uncharacterized protein